LAHELTHTLQQTGATNNTPLYSSNHLNKIQRRVSPDFPTIKDKLTRGIFDWAVTDSDAHTALLLLKKLNTTDLRDTVAAMERSDLVDTFFDNLTDKDAANESEFLQQVQNFRTHSVTIKNGNSTTTTSSTFSCTLEQGNILYRSMTTAQNWLDTAISKLRDYIAAPGAPGMQDIRDALQANVHTLNPVHINLLLTRLQSFRSQMFSGNNLEVECAAPGDGLCKDIAAAYVQHGVPQKMRFCHGFFSADDVWRIEATIHEAMHAFFSNSSGGTVTDRAYAHERVYEFLKPEEAFDNSDSIATLVQALALGNAATAKYMRHPKDSISDCSKEQHEMLRPAIARAARWNLNSINVLADTRTDFRNGYSDLRKQYFGDDSFDKIPTLVEVYKKSQSKFEDSISVECESAGGACSSDTFGYYRSFIFKSGTLHVCPVFFAMSEDNRIKSFLSLAIMNSSGKSDAESAKYAEFAKAVTDRYWAMPNSLPNS